MDSPECSIYASVCCTLNWVIGMCVLRERTLIISGGLVSLQPQHTNVCFWYLPPGVRYLEDKVEKMKRLHKVRKIRFNQWMWTELLHFKWCILLLQQWYIAVKKNINLKALFGGSERPQGHLNNPKTYLTLRYQVNTACYYLSKRINNPPLAYTIYEILYFWDFSIFRFCVGQRNIPCKKDVRLIGLNVHL